MLRKWPRVKWASMFIYLLAIIGVYEGTVLCFGADGHIRIELSKNSFLSQSSEENAPEDSYRHAMPRLSPAGNNCGPCVDLAFRGINNNGQLAPNQSKSPKRQLVTAPMLPQAVPSFVVKASKGYSSNPQLLADRTLASLRTVILIS